MYNTIYCDVIWTNGSECCDKKLGFLQPIFNFIYSTNIKPKQLKGAQSSGESSPLCSV